MAKSITDRDPKHRPSSGVSFIIAFGIAAVVAFGAVSLYNGGLPGTKNSPSATVNGQTTVGKSGTD
jgi:hypothetical protein